MLLTRTDISQISAEFTLGDRHESAVIMIEGALSWIQAPEQESNHHAQYIRGCCLQSGLHWPQDGKAGLELIRAAAEGGHASAQCKLGFAYNSGTDVEQDRVKAFE